jgi:putative adhesin
MSMPLDQPGQARPPSPIRQFLRTWRRELVRGGVLFGVVVVIGLLVNRARVGFSTPWDFARNFGGFDMDGGDLFGSGREIGDEWRWHGVITPSQNVWIRNTSGPVEVVAGTGPTLEVIAEKSWKHSDPGTVEIVPVQTERGVTICAVWSAREHRCGDGGDYKLTNLHRNDVAVRFTVRLPRGVSVDVSTLNGEVAIDGATAPVKATTLNGRIRLHTTTGPVHATTVNGAVEARIDALTNGDVELQTVNGSVTAVFPENLNAVLEASTVNGRVDTDFPLQITGKITPRQAHGTIGKGGPTLKLGTVNGSIALRRAGDELVAPVRVEPRRARERRAAARAEQAVPPPPVKP